MRNYTENADSLLEQYPTKTVPLSKQEEKRIYDMALKKIEKEGSYTPPKLKKHRRVPVCVAAAVAATCVLSAGIAAAPYIKELAGGKIGFFTDAKSQAQVQNVLDAPRGEYPTPKPTTPKSVRRRRWTASTTRWIRCPWTPPRWIASLP